MREILKIAFGSSHQNGDVDFAFDGEDYRVKRLGADFRPDLAIELVRSLRDECDVFALSGFPPVLRLGKEQFSHPLLKQLRDAAGSKPMFDGTQLRRTCFPWALKTLIRQEPHLLTGKKVGFFFGVLQWDFLPFFEEQAGSTVFADLFFALGLPKLLHSQKEVGKSFGRLVPALGQVKLGRRTVKDFDSYFFRVPLMREFHRCDVYVMNRSQLDYVRLWPLEGKTVIVDCLDAAAHEKLLAAGAGRVISCFPQFGPYPEIGYSALESVFALRQGVALEDEALLHEVRKLHVQAEPHDERRHPPRKRKFAFVIHPLTRKQLFQVKLIKGLENTAAARGVEKVMGHLPGFFYAKMKGIVSEFDGQEIEGELYALPATPKQLLRADPEDVYRRIGQICELAHKRGTDIIGLGAFTKIVGDAGVTIEKRSPIPVTTGNSLSAAATLWAASFGLEHMDLVPRDPATGRYKGTAMVIGATGSIGKVCARHLCHHWERVVLVAPRPYKVLDLVEEMKGHCPGTEIIGTTNPDKYSPGCDLIITSTSAQGEKIMEIGLVKPGAVICDVSRPFDLTLDDAASRPDVLVIASGEVELPGKLKVGKTLNLEGDAVYACLAETALLAMEGRFESFSLSRDLDYDKVIEIDRLSRKHGIRLSAVMGHTGEITLQEIELCRKLALEKRQS